MEALALFHRAFFDFQVSQKLDQLAAWSSKAREQPSRVI